MKKLFAILLVMCIGMTVFCSCGGDETEETDAATESVGTGEFANDNEANYHSSWQ